VPELGNLTRDPQQLEWIAGLPFRYDSLDADKVIGIIQRVSKWSPAEGATSLGRLQAQLATEGGKREQVGFQLALSQDAEGKKQLDIEKTAPAG
jgi:hypothetical protein